MAIVFSFVVGLSSAEPSLTRFRDFDGFVLVGMAVNINLVVDVTGKARRKG